MNRQTGKQVIRRVRVRAVPAGGSAARWRVTGQVTG